MNSIRVLSRRERIRPSLEYRARPGDSGFGGRGRSLLVCGVGGIVLALLFSLPVPVAGNSAEDAKALPSKSEPAHFSVQGLVWPPPPLEPRIRYLRAIATSDDVRGEKGFWRKVWEFFRGSEVAAMVKPMAVAADGEGRIYVADPAAKGVHLFDPGRKRYRFIEEVGREKFQFPINVTVDQKGNFYVVDGQLKRVFMFSPAGKPLKVYGEGRFKRPVGVAVDRQRQRLYVTDPPAHNIKVFDLESGELRHVWGKRGTELGAFNFPVWLALGKAGHLYVTDSLNGRVQRLSPKGVALASVGKLGDGTGDFTTPKGIALDSDGHLYVADAGFDAIQIFDHDGRLLLYFGGTGQAEGLFWMPGGIAIDPHDRIYVADSYNRRIQIFQYLKKRDKERRHSGGE